MLAGASRPHHPFSRRSATKWCLRRFEAEPEMHGDEMARDHKDNPRQTPKQ